MPRMTDSSNVAKYSLFAPFYDKLVRRGTVFAIRRRAFELLSAGDGQRVLLDGVGTGEDVAFLPDSSALVAIDITPGMLARARAKSGSRSPDLLLMNAKALGFSDASFDAVVMMLLLAAVEDPRAALAEGLRVLRPGGRILIFDKFEPEGERPTRWLRAADLLATSIATRLTLRFSTVVDGMPAVVVHDEPSLFGGRFRIIVLEKVAPATE